MFIWKKAAKFKTIFLIPLYVLLWRYAKLQFYRYGHTFWELFGSLIFFVIVTLLHQINVSQPGKIIDSTPITLDDSHESLVRVFYEPYNSFTRHVMYEAEIYLAQNSDPKQRWEFQSIGFPVNFHADFFDTKNGIALVKFKNASSLQTGLDYTISVLCDEAKSNFDVAFHGVLQPISPKVDLAPSFLADLQWAIDKSYIEQLTTQDINQFVMMTAITDVIKDELLTIRKFILICSILGPLPFFLVFASKLVEERRSGMKELMRQAGISASVRRAAYYVEALIASILYSAVVTTLLKVSSEPVLQESDSFIVAFTISFHFVNTMCLAFVTTIVCQDIKYTDCLSCITYMSPFLLEFLWNSYKEFTFILYYILPHAPMYLFWEEVLYLENLGQGTQFWNICKYHSDNYRVIGVWVAFFVQQVLTLLLAWYLDHVRPGYYGISKNLCFFLRKIYWRPMTKRRLIELPMHFTRNESHFQKIPKNVEIAVQVLNVSKVFKNKRRANVTALDSVSFNCCKGEVTVLLGANGAGKSTLLLIVAGMLSVSDGHVFVEGFKVGSKMVERYHNVRICMQKAMCFRYLTVRENVTFFSRLRRSTEGFSVDHLLKKLKLLEISDHYGYHLSAGSLKCLQVACVLAGDADVLLLDEPTTGMEIEVRLRLWDMLMVLRSNKTILMATSSLEEAIALGDRIVLLDKGVLKCHGSPMFLKNVIGTCFTLSIIIKSGARLYDLKELVDSIIPDLECHIYDMTRIVFSVPTRELEHFPNLLEALEGKKEPLGIVLMDVGMFMEEVFDKFVDPDTVRESAIGIRRKSRMETIVYRKRIKGYRLKCRQTIMLTIRFIDNILVQRGLFLSLRFLVPIFCLVNVTLTSNYSLRNKRMFNEDRLVLDSEIANLVYNVPSPISRTSLLEGVEAKYPGVKTEYLKNIDDAFIRAPAVHSNKETVGFEITDVYIRIIHPIDPKMTSKTVNMFSNIYMSMYVPYSNNTIRTSYEPLAKAKPIGVREVKSSFLCLRWSCWVTFLSVFPLAPTVVLCICERKFGIRDNHMMAGCSPMIHWSSRLIAHMTIFSLVILIPLIIICVFLDIDRTFLQLNFLGSFISMSFMFGLAFHTCLYVWSFRLNENVAVCQIYIASLFFGIVLPVLQSVLEVFAKKMVAIAVPYYILEVVARLSPMYALGIGMARLTLRARLNAFCKLNRHKCPDLKFDDESFDVDVCCNSVHGTEAFPYLASHDTGLFDILTLFIQFIVYGTVVILLEYRTLQTIQEKIAFYRFKKSRRDELDTPSVLQERSYVQTSLRTQNYTDDVILVNDLHKYYTDTEFTKKKQKICAVKGITFAAKLGECLAILGTQSAGKTALLNMMAGTTVMTKGETCIQGTFLTRKRMKYMHKISLSSATGGMDDFMTGLENLVFVAKLNGHSNRMAYFLAFKALTLMGLMSIKGTVSEYSIGCLRRLSLCCVLVLAPRVALLDEPMNEIDASSKSLVAKAMLHLKKEPAAIIVTETTMEWTLMQQLFDRIAIMSKGQFAVIGPATEVLESITTGFTARIKLKMLTAYRRDRYHGTADDEWDDTFEEPPASPTEKSVMFAQTLIDFKADFLKSFQPSRLCSEHLCMLFFYIDDTNKTQRYSTMFIKLQNLKEKYNDLIEDYDLSFTTVEDFFWSLEYELGAMQNKPRASISAAYDFMQGSKS